MCFQTSRQTIVLNVQYSSLHRHSNDWLYYGLPIPHCIIAERMIWNPTFQTLLLWSARCLWLCQAIFTHHAITIFWSDTWTKLIYENPFRHSKLLYECCNYCFRQEATMRVMKGTWFFISLCCNDLCQPSHFLSTDQCQEIEMVDGEQGLYF